MKKTVVIYHRADFDGIFCREIARKFLPEAELVGWDYGDPEPGMFIAADTQLYILDLSVPSLMDHPNLVWIDHHKSAIEKYPATIPGYRIDGVAACRLAWQWFAINQFNAHNVTNPALNVPFPFKQDFIDRAVSEPLAVRLAGEYDIWDKRDPRADVFQMGLRSRAIGPDSWDILLSGPTAPEGDKQGLAEIYVDALLNNGEALQYYANERDANTVNHLSFLVELEGLKFLALNSAGKGSLQFAAKDVPETGHDALLKFNFNGKVWDVSLYHAKHRTELDLSQIAVKFGGGGHRGACGFRSAKLPFLP